MSVSSQLEPVVGGVDFRINVVLRPEAGERVTQYWIKGVLFREGRTIPFNCFLDSLRLFL